MKNCPWTHKPCLYVSHILYQGNGFLDCVGIKPNPDFVGEDRVDNIVCCGHKADKESATVRFSTSVMTKDEALGLIYLLSRAVFYLDHGHLDQAGFFGDKEVYPPGPRKESKTYVEGSRDSKSPAPSTINRRREVK